MDGLTGLVFSVFLFIVSCVVLYYIVHAAVRNALIRHYKTVRWFEQTGEWMPASGDVKKPPRPLDGSRKLGDPTT